MKVIFAGTPDFAVPSLKALLENGADVVAVFTQPDRPAGRGRKLTQSAVKQFVVDSGVNIFQPQRLDNETIQTIESLQPDLMVVVAYGLILPKVLLDIPRLGCVNVHASLLPRWRGAAPIARAIEAGDKTTGITLMQMDSGLDSGAILKQVEAKITKTDTAQKLHDRLADLGGDLLAQSLSDLSDGRLKAVGQDEANVTYARKLSKSESRIDWSLAASVLERKIRAFNPWPVASAILDNMSVRIWMAGANNENHGETPGQITDTKHQGITVQTGNGVLHILELQKQGGKRLSAAAFLNGVRISAGDTFS